MKHNQIEKVYAWILLIIFGLIVVHAPLSVYFGTLLPHDSLLIKSWKEILMLLAVPFAIILVWRRQLWRELLKDRVMQLLAAYTGLHVLVAAALLTGPLATMAGLAIDLRYIIFFGLVYILMKAAPRYRRLFLQVAVGGAVVVIGFAVLQIFLPKDILTHIGYSENTIQPYLTVDKNPQFIRVNSTMRGPNPLGAYAVIVLGMLAGALARRRVKLEKSRTTIFAAALAAGSVIALWISYSRSALVAAVVAVGIVAAMALRHHVPRRAWIIGAIILCALAGGLFAERSSTLVTNIVLHENRHGGSLISSNAGHVSSLEIGVRRMLRQPLGAGVGSTGSASLFTDVPLVIENQYLFVAHEVGWLGLGLFIALLAVMLTKLWQCRRDWLSLGVFASGIGLLIIGLLLPVWVDDTVSIIWWGLAAIALGAGGKNGRQPAK